MQDKIEHIEEFNIKIDNPSYLSENFFLIDDVDFQSYTLIINFRISEEYMKKIDNSLQFVF